MAQAFPLNTSDFQIHLSAGEDFIDDLGTV